MNESKQMQAVTNVSIRLLSGFKPCQCKSVSEDKLLECPAGQLEDLDNTSGQDLISQIFNPYDKIDFRNKLNAKQYLSCYSLDFE